MGWNGIEDVVMADTTGKTSGASSNAAAAYESEGSVGEAGQTHDLLAGNPFSVLLAWGT